jgi:hypothetical protein
VKRKAPLLAVDFDGTIADSYPDGQWIGAKMPAPMPGALDALLKLRQAGYRMVVFSHRAESSFGRDLIGRFLNEHRIANLFEGVVSVKPQADAYIDDRGIHFSSWASILAHFGLYTPTIEPVLSPGGAR